MESSTVLLLRELSSPSRSVGLRPTFEQFRQANLKRVPDQFNVLKANIPFAALDAADVTAVKTHAKRKFLLAPATILAELPNAIPEESFDIVVGHGDRIVLLDDHASTDLKSRSH